MSKSIFGSKDKFAFVLGRRANSEFQEVDIWIAGERLTFIDNTAYLPQFISSLETELKDLKAGKIDADSVFLNLGPTLDDVSARVEISKEQVFVKCHLYKGDGKIISTRIGKGELIEIYQACIEKLKE